MEAQKQACILEVLRSVGVYERSRSEVSSDQELAILFDQDFDNLVERLMCKKNLPE